ncbi:unnamed protein product [Enterobius vermicularis]|uniref:CC domain-containing protein n=1 Tax=Enterobius vermicularis TaxID=51028 RepID=A0A0N4V266_ENTVE|nr:unnamed protein product [Enterobius vermicularis]
MELCFRSGLKAVKVPLFSVICISAPLFIKQLNLQYLRKMIHRNELVLVALLNLAIYVIIISMLTSCDISVLKIEVWSYDGRLKIDLRWLHKSSNDVLMFKPKKMLNGLIILTLVIIIGVEAVKLPIRRTKRYSYYTCGVWPNQYTSLIPCDSYGSNAVCSNTGHYMGRRCIYSSDCSMLEAPSSCLDGLCCSIPYVTPATAPLCGGISQSGGYCTNGFCSDGYVCTASNICCHCYAGSDAGKPKVKKKYCSNKIAPFLRILLRCMLQQWMPNWIQLFQHRKLNRFVWIQNTLYFWSMPNWIFMFGRTVLLCNITNINDNRIINIKLPIKCHIHGVLNPADDNWLTYQRVVKSCCHINEDAKKEKPK